MQSQFETFTIQNSQKQKKSLFDNEKITEIIDKQDEIMVKLSSLQKFQQKIKEQYTSINEGIDGMNENNEKYYNGTIKKMGDYHSKVTQSINDIDIQYNTEQKSNGG